MNKYLLSGLTGAAALLLVVSPVAAYGNHHYRGMQPGLVIENEADVNTNIEVIAGTGFNEQSVRGAVSGMTYSPNKLRLSNTLFTGDASAYGEVTNELNNGDNCDCYSRRGTKLENDAEIDTQMKVKAVTDDNSQELSGYVGSSSKTSQHSRRHHRPMMGAGGDLEASNYAETGNAVAQGSVWNIVNSRYSMMQ